MYTSRRDWYLDVFYRDTRSLHPRRGFAPSNRTSRPRPNRAHRAATQTGNHCRPHIRPGPSSSSSSSFGSSSSSSSSGGLLLPSSPSCSRPSDTNRLLCTRQEEERLFLQRQEAVQKAGIQQKRMRVGTTDSEYLHHIESTFSNSTVSLSWLAAIRSNNSNYTFALEHC